MPDHDCHTTTHKDDGCEGCRKLAQMIGLELWGRSMIRQEVDGKDLVDVIIEVLRRDDE